MRRVLVSIVNMLRVSMCIINVRGISMWNVSVCPRISVRGITMLYRRIRRLIEVWNVRVGNIGVWPSIHV